MAYPTIISNHSVAFIPPEGSRILDVGCRSFAFSQYFADRNCKVCAVEPDSTVKSPSSKIVLIQAALVPRYMDNHDADLVCWQGGEGNHLRCIKGEIPASSWIQRTKCYSLPHIMNIAKIPFWEIVKLDCEGSEYDILLDWPGPIAEQITVEFHEHTGANIFGPDIYTAILAHLGQWYRIVQHEASVRYQFGGKNYWDSLFILHSKSLTKRVRLQYEKEYDNIQR